MKHCPRAVRVGMDAMDLDINTTHTVPVPKNGSGKKEKLCTGRQNNTKHARARVNSFRHDAIT